MKKTFLAVLTVLSISSAFAQSLEMEIRRKIDRLAIAGDDRVIARLSRVEKDELNSLMDRALRVLRDDGRDGLPDDNRRPVPGPGPRRDDDFRPGPVGPGPVIRDDRRDEGRFGRHGLREGMLIAAIVEDTVVIVRGRGPGDLLLSCTQAVNDARLVRADNMIVTVNGGRYQGLSTAGWWTGAAQICTTMLSVAQTEDYGRAPYIEVAGTVEQLPLRLEGSRGEILEECAEAVRGLNRADDMNISVNRGRLVQATTGGWWTGAAAICGQVAAIVDGQVR